MNHSFTATKIPSHLYIHDQANSSAEGPAQKDRPPVPTFEGEQSLRIDFLKKCRSADPSRWLEVYKEFIKHGGQADLQLEQTRVYHTSVSASIRLSERSLPHEGGQEKSEAMQTTEVRDLDDIKAAIDLDGQDFVLYEEYRGRTVATLSLYLPYGSNMP